MKRIVFMGSDPISLPLLNYLLHEQKSAQLMAIVSQPDRPKGRGKKLQPNAIAAWGEEQGIPVFKPEKPGEAESTYLKEQAIDLVLVMAYGHILRKSLLAIPPLGFLNFHASILPAYRGASPIETSIACGEPETGVTLMQIMPAMDAGPMLDVEKVAITPNDSGATMREKLADACVPLMARNLETVLSGTATFTEQDASAATYCRMLKKTDGQLDFQAPAAELVSRINGLDPWPGCYCELEDVRLKLRLASCVNQPIANAVPGTILKADAEGVVIATGEGALCVHQLQRPGGKMLPAKDFLLGFPLVTGTVLKNYSMEPLLRAR